MLVNVMTLRYFYSLGISPESYMHLHMLPCELEKRSVLWKSHLAI